MDTPTRDFGARLSLRCYQLRIVQDAMQCGNTLVMLPTGSGKTLIAAEVARRVGAKVLFLVPTRLLVEQQAKAVREWTGMRVEEYMGDGRTFPHVFDVLVTTPKAFEIAQGRDASSCPSPTLGWQSFRLVIFDEVHHVLKDHPYRKMAHGICKLEAGKGVPQILGLTASLTYAVGEKQVEASVKSICEDLRIKKMSSADMSELQAAGYHGTSEYELRSYDLTQVHLTGLLPFDARKPHLMIPTFFQRIKTGQALSFTIALENVIRAMEGAVKDVDPNFKSPLESAVKEWGLYAHRQAGKSEKYAQLEFWYEALRILAVSWEEAQDAAVEFLKMNKVESRIGIWPPQVQCQIYAFWMESPTSFPRFENLKEVLKHEFEKNQNFRGLLFVQQRVTTHILEHIVRSDQDLSNRFTTACLYATTAAATASLAVTARDAKERLRAFADGTVNLLITTVVAEEGMDVPAANCVLRFDPMLNSVSLVQGRGRARQANSSFIVLSERPDRSTKRLVEAEHQQLDIVRNFQPQNLQPDNKKTRQAQESRERSAVPSLQAWDGSLSTSISTLNLCCKKTKVDLEERTSENTESVSVRHFNCCLLYESALRRLEAEGMAVDAKSAKRVAAQQLLLKMRIEFV
jgi:ERCC4-related helicase